MKLGLLLFIGIPGSGKTTLAETLKKHYQFYNNDQYYFIHICYDELITYKNQDVDFEWKAARNSVSEKVEKLVEAIQSGDCDLCPLEFRNKTEFPSVLNGNVVLILDDNMYFKSMRYSLYQIARKHNISFCQVYIRCPLQDALLKNSLRTPQSITPPYIIENMYNKIESPNQKNYWERYSVEVNAFCDVNKFVNKLFPVLNESLLNYECLKENCEEKQLSMLQCKTSVFHQTDIALRYLVGLKIKEFIMKNSKKDLKEYSSQLNARKSDVIADIKMGNICLPEKVLEEINQDVEEKTQLLNFLNEYF